MDPGRHLRAAPESIRVVTVFLDTNVLVYAHDAHDEAKATRAISLLTELWAPSGAVNHRALRCRPCG